MVGCASVSFESFSFWRQRGGGAAARRQSRAALARACARPPAVKQHGLHSSHGVRWRRHGGRAWR